MSRIQDEIGFPFPMPANRHLDTLDGRLWLQLEWRALERALRTDKQECHRAIEDALIFRAYRQSLFPDSASGEHALEMNEGLAEYTGVKLSDMSNLTLANRIQRSTRRESFTRSFAYVSGPMYGVLLDEAGADWRSGLKPEDDLGILLRESFGINLPKDLAEEADKRSINYGGVELRIAEAERDRRRQAQMAEYRARLIEKPVLIVPLTEEMGYTFDPNELVPLNDYETFSIQQQCELQDTVAKRNELWIRQKFADLNATWLFVIDGDVIACGSDLSSYPEDDFIDFICQQTGKFPFVFIDNERELLIEEGIAWHKTSRENDWYPTLEYKSKLKFLV